MNWIFQRRGPINHYKEGIYNGTQPVRVIHNLVVYMFQHTHPLFFEELKEQIEKGKLNRELNLVYAEESIRKEDGKLRTPKVNGDSRNIELHESFLSYLWCCTYSIFVTYVETVDYPNVNKINGNITHPISQENIDEARELFDYARTLISYYSPWDKNLPNPEIYLAEKRNYVEQTNIYYTQAVKFILSHEYTHLKLHIDQIDKDTGTSHYLMFEMEADNNAIDLLKKDLTDSANPVEDGKRLAVENGIVMGLLSMLFFYSSTKGVKHPNSEDRLTNALERLNLKDNPYAWGLACVGLKFWDKQFDLKFEWDENAESDKYQYYFIIKQIKERN